MVDKGLRTIPLRDQPDLSQNVSTDNDIISGVSSHISMLIITIFIGMPLSLVLLVPSTVQSGCVHECNSLRRPRLVELKYHDL